MEGLLIIAIVLFTIGQSQTNETSTFFNQATALGEGIARLESARGRDGGTFCRAQSYKVNGKYFTTFYGISLTEGKYEFVEINHENGEINIAQETIFPKSNHPLYAKPIFQEWCDWKEASLAPGTRSAIYHYLRSSSRLK